MPKRITTIDVPLGAFWGCLVGNLVIVVVLVTTAIVLTRFSALIPQPGAAPDFGDGPGSGVIIRSEVIHLWLPETVVDLARHGSPALAARSHQELKEVLERRGQQNLWYAITIRGHQANDGASDISFIRYPYREPERDREFTDVLATVAGSPTRQRSADYSKSTVHITPAGMSQREWLESMRTSLLLR
jgi:hypothetical protein